MSRHGENCTAETSGPHHLCGCIGNGLVNPRMIGFISLCIHFRWYFLLTSRTSAPIEQNVVPIALELLTRWEDHSIFHKTQHVGSITQLLHVFVIASSSAMMFSTSIHICCSISMCKLDIHVVPDQKKNIYSLKFISSTKKPIVFRNKTFLSSNFQVNAIQQVSHH